MVEFLQSSLKNLTVIAEAWLESTASSFSFWSDGRLIKQWEKDLSDGVEIISAPVRMNGTLFGEFQVIGTNLSAAQPRLMADAKIAATMLHLDGDRMLVCEELIDARDQLVILSSLSNLTRKVIDIEELLKVLAAEANKLVKAEEIYFLLNVEDRTPIWTTFPEQIYDYNDLYEISRKISPIGGPHMVSDIQQKARNGKSHNFLIIPIKMFHAELAVMGIIGNVGRDFSSYEIRLARAIADYASEQIEKIGFMRTSIEMARIETEITLAQKIQQSLLLKKIPAIDRLDICMAFQPASRISGDYYDIIVKPDRKVDFIIGDISGKGMPAALLMAMTLKVLRSVVSMPSSPTPDITINRSNEILYKDYSDSVMFSTLFIGQFDPVTREIQFSNAGHSPVIYCPAGGKAEMLRPHSVPLGLFPDLVSQNNKLRLSSGDILVLATDGINETSNRSNRLFGFTQLMTLIQTEAHKSAGELSESILNAVRIYGAGKNQEDDRAMIIIKGI